MRFLISLIVIGTWITSAVLAGTVEGKCPYVFTKDSKIAIVHYGDFEPQAFVDRIVKKLDENAGYILVRPEMDLKNPAYSFHYAIEADGNAKRVNPAITLIYRTGDEAETRMIMKSKRVRNNDSRLSAVEALIDSAVRDVPVCPARRNQRH